MRARMARSFPVGCSTGMSITGAWMRKPASLRIWSLQGLSTRQRSCARLCKTPPQLLDYWLQPKPWWPSGQRKRLRCLRAAWEEWAAAWEEWGIWASKPRPVETIVPSLAVKECGFYSASLTREAALWCGRGVIRRHEGVDEREKAFHSGQVSTIPLFGR